MSNLRLLLIDDNPDDRTLALRELKREFPKLKAIEIAELTQFTQILEQDDFNFNFVITDYQLRWSNGLKILQTVKERRLDCPVIMFTGTGSEEIAVKAMKAGLDDYVLKSPQHYLSLAAAVRLAWERNQQRQALQEAQKRYRQLFEGVPVGLYRLTPAGQIIEANATLVQMLGYTDREAISKDKAVNYHLDAESRHAWKHQINSQGIVQNLETPLRRCDGTMIWVRHSARAVKDYQGLLYYEGAIEDITEHKQAEIERAELLAREQKAHEDAVAANRIKDEFLATLSHELRTPLNAILGWVQLLKAGKLSQEKATHAIEIIERNARTQTQLIEDLLDISRIIRGKMQLRLRPVVLKGIILAALDTVRPAAEAKNIELKSIFDPVVEPVSGDSDRLQQIIWNLLVNAVKFTPVGGKVTVRLRQMENYLQVQVSDTGQGIDPEFLPYLFERFRQVETTSKRSHGGLGLGLAIVRHLVELHGGNVDAESAGLGKGATFTIELPLLEDNRMLNKQPLVRESSAAIQLPDLNGLQILVVEDEADTREMIALILEECDANVSAVASVAEALAMLEKERPDVLISDIAMPQADGYDLIRQIRQSEQDQAKSLPAIALTAYATEQDRHKAIAAGFQLHLSKPIEPNQLATAVASLKY